MAAVARQILRVERKAARHRGVSCPCLQTGPVEIANHDGVDVGIQSFDARDGGIAQFKRPNVARGQCLNQLAGCGAAKVRQGIGHGETSGQHGWIGLSGRRLTTEGDKRQRFLLCRSIRLGRPPRRDSNPLIVKFRRFWCAYQHEGEIVEDATAHLALAQGIATGDEVAAIACANRLMDYLEVFARKIIDS